MINKQTIISSFDDKGTLLKWLKAVESALEKASATEFLISKKGNSTISFILKFADDTQLESGDITLEQGESVESASIVNGHLLLTLTNGEVLDAGELFNGNVNIDGNFTANSIIENMGSDYGIELIAENKYFQTNYAGAVKNGNKLTLVLAGTFTRTTETPANIAPCYFLIPKNVGDKLFSNSLGALDNKQVLFMDSTTSGVSKFSRITKASSATPDIARLLVTFYGVNSLTIGTPYEFRYEVTFLLSDNLAE